MFHDYISQDLKKQNLKLPFKLYVHPLCVLLCRFNALKDPMAQRRKKLEDSLRWHQYNFDANSELNWIQEHMPAATSTEYGKNLVDAQNLHAKHKVSSQGY